MASAAARLVFLSGFRVIVLERAEPLAVRRLVSFATALAEGPVWLEGVEGRRVDAADELEGAASFVAVLVDPDAESLARLRPDVLVDGRMLKRSSGTSIAQAPLVVGLGPGFAAGVDAHAVVETQRGPDLGRVLWSGTAEPDSARPAPVLGFTDQRVVRAPRSGRFASRAQIGDLVAAGDVLGSVEDQPLIASLSGLVRGLISHGTAVEAGTKLGDIDPRGAAVRADRISDKARAVAAGVLEAILLGRRLHPNSV
jgi:xanthine dehydrogenase accessory factor